MSMIRRPKTRLLVFLQAESIPMFADCTSASIPSAIVVRGRPVSSSLFVIEFHREGINEFSLEMVYFGECRVAFLKIWGHFALSSLTPNSAHSSRCPPVDATTTFTLLHHLPTVYRVAPKIRRTPLETLKVSLHCCL